VKLDEVIRMTKCLSVPFEGAGTLEIEYRPVATGDSELQALSRKAVDSGDENQCRRWIAEYLARVVAWWDLYDDNKPLPLTPEAIERLPVYFLTTVLGAIVADMNGTNKADRG
jgi:hypothetical protein